MKNECGMILAFKFSKHTHLSNWFRQLSKWYICKDRSPQPSRKTVWICPAPPTLTTAVIWISWGHQILCLVCCQLCVCPAFRTTSKLQSFEKRPWRALNLLFKRKVSYSYKSFLLDSHHKRDDSEFPISHPRSEIPYWRLENNEGVSDRWVIISERSDAQDPWRAGTECGRSCGGKAVKLVGMQ